MHPAKLLIRKRKMLCAVTMTVLAIYFNLVLEWPLPAVFTPIGPKSEDRMFKEKELAVKGQMAVGRLFRFLGISLAVIHLQINAGIASPAPQGDNEVSDGALVQPRFFNYQAPEFRNQIRPPRFGLFHGLSKAQINKYYEAISHALMAAENGESVSWIFGNASGQVAPVLTWPTGSGYCRRVQILVQAFGSQAVQSETACFIYAENAWRWRIP